MLYWPAQAMVSLAGVAQVSGSSSSASQARPAVAGFNSTPVPSSVTSDGLVLERGRLEDLGCSNGVISTLMNARRTNKVYGRIWSKFVEYMSTVREAYSNPEIQDILVFLQMGLDLAVSSFRVQVSALLAVTGVSWAKHSLVHQFFRGAARLRPQRKPRFTKWDLPLFDFLSETGKECARSISIKDLSIKSGLLVAITSAKRVLC